MGKRKAMNFRNTVFVIALLLSLSPFALADDAISVIQNPGDLPANVVVDSYLITNPSVDTTTTSYFTLKSENRIPFDLFLQGVISLEIGDGLDKGTLINGQSKNRHQVEAIKAQAVATTNVFEQTSHTSNQDFYVAQNENIARTFVQTGTKQTYVKIPLWTDAAGDIHVSVGNPKGDKVQLDNGQLVNQPSNPQWVDFGYDPGTNGYSVYDVAAVESGTVPDIDDSGNNVSVAIVGVYAGCNGQAMRFPGSTKLTFEVDYFGETQYTPGIFTNYSEGAPAYGYTSWKVDERMSLSGVLPSEFGYTVDELNTFPVGVHGVGMYQTGAVEIAREFKDPLAGGTYNVDHNSDYIAILKHYFHPAPPILSAVTILQGNGPTTIYGAGWSPVTFDSASVNAASSVNAIVPQLKRTMQKGPSTPASAFAPITIQLFFTEQMNNLGPVQLTDGSVTVSYADYSNPTSLSASSPEEWDFIFTPDTLSQLTHGSAGVTLMVNAENANDSNFVLDSNPDTVSLDGVGVAVPNAMNATNAKSKPTIFNAYKKSLSASAL